MLCCLKTFASIAKTSWTLKTRPSIQLVTRFTYFTTESGQDGGSFFSATATDGTSRVAGTAGTDAASAATGVAEVAATTGAVKATGGFGFLRLLFRVFFLFRPASLRLWAMLRMLELCFRWVSAQPKGHLKSHRPALRGWVKKKMPQCQHRVRHCWSRGWVLKSDRRSR